MRNLPYDRSERVGKQIYQVIASYIYENVDDERLKGVQFTAVRLTKDLSIARIYYYVEGDKERRERCLAALEDIRVSLRQFIGHEVRLRVLPKLEFFLDEGIENAERIQEIFKELESQK